MLDMKDIKKYLSVAVTVLVAVALFGLVFVVLGVGDINSAFTLETCLITTATVILRFFWYDDGEDKAINEDSIKTLKNDYADLVEEKIKDQEDLEIYLEELNRENRENWVKYKLGSKNKNNCKNYDELKAKYERQAGNKVKPITSTQIMTRSEKSDVITAKDYNKRKKITYQTVAVTITTIFTILLSLVVFDDFKMSIENVFKYIAYLATMLWTILKANIKGYKTYILETVDHISRLTMIVNRYNTWKEKRKGDEECQVIQEKLPLEKLIIEQQPE